MAKNELASQSSKEGRCPRMSQPISQADALTISSSKSCLRSLESCRRHMQVYKAVLCAPTYCCFVRANTWDSSPLTPRWLVDTYHRPISTKKPKFSIFFINSQSEEEHTDKAIERHMIAIIHHCTKSGHGFPAVDGSWGRRPRVISTLVPAGSSPGDASAPTWRFYRK